MTRAAPQSQPLHRSASVSASTSSSSTARSTSSRQQQNQHSNPSSPSSVSTTMMKTAFHRHASTGDIISGSGSSIAGGSSGSSNGRQTKAANSNKSNQPSATATATSPPSPTSPSSTSYSTPANNTASTATTKLLPSFVSSISLTLLQWFFHQILMRISLFYGYSRGRYNNINNGQCNNENIVDNDVIKAMLLHRKKAISSAMNENSEVNDDGHNYNYDVFGEKGQEVNEYFDSNDNEEYLRVKASPGLTTLLDNELYRAYEAELLPTVASASQLLHEFIEMKEASALILRECRWMVGVPFSGGMSLCQLKHSKNVDTATHKKEEEKVVVAVGRAVLHDVFVGEGAVVDANGMPAVDYLHPDTITTSEAAAEAMHSEDIANWNEFETLQDFAHQCYLAANEAIHRLTTDRFADSANRTLQDSLMRTSDGLAETTAAGIVHTNGGGAADTLPTLQPITQPSASLTSLLPQLPLSSSPTDAGIGRIYQTQCRRDCWESPRLYCPDYYWADDAIGGCQRLLKNLSKHRFVSLVNIHGWERYNANKSRVASRQKGSNILHPATYASSTPHVFPSLEAVHSMHYLVSDLLSTTIPSRLNQFRAATESNAVVSKRLYLVKCEYRAPMRALWESCTNLNAAPKAELVERYLRDYHGVKVGECGCMQSGVSGSSSGEGGGIISDGGVMSGVGKSLSGRRRSTIDSTEVTKKSSLQQQREKLEKLITEKYWKHPAFVEALQLERCCEQLEMEMSQMLYPFASLAYEIMNFMKGRLRAVAVENNYTVGQYDEENSSSAGTFVAPVRVRLPWHDVPYMRELLRRLKSILRRKPDTDESHGIRPLLIDLQGVPRHNRDQIDSSIEIPLSPPLSRTHEHEWFHLDQFISEVGKLLDLLTIPNSPFIVDDKIHGTKGNKSTLHDLIEQCKEVWDDEMFCAWYKDWFEMVQRQQELNAGTHDARSTTNERSHHEAPTSLFELSEIVCEAEIELSIAMASKDQLKRVYTRIEALRADKAARYKVLAQIVFDVGYRELNNGILVQDPSDYEPIEYPQLSLTGVFGDQLILSGEFLPMG